MSPFIIALAGATHVQSATATSAATFSLAHLTRAAAVTGYVALTLSVALGLLRSISSQRGWRITWLLEDVHQFIALLAVALVVMHLAMLALDPLLPFAPIMLLLPIGDPARPLAHALAALALYSLIVVSLSSWLRHRLAYTAWLRLHTFSFIAFQAATFHGLLAGNDTTHPWMRAIYIACSAIVTLLVFARLRWHTSSRRAASTRPSPAPSAPLR